MNCCPYCKRRHCQSFYGESLCGPATFAGGLSRQEWKELAQDWATNWNERDSPFEGWYNPSAHVLIEEPQYGEAGWEALAYNTDHHKVVFVLTGN